MNLWKTWIWKAVGKVEDSETKCAGWKTWRKCCQAQYRLRVGQDLGIPEKMRPVEVQNVSVVFEQYSLFKGTKSRSASWNQHWPSSTRFYLQSIFISLFLSQICSMLRARCTSMFFVTSKPSHAWGLAFRSARGSWNSKTPFEARLTWSAKGDFDCPWRSWPTSMLGIWKTQMAKISWQSQQPALSSPCRWATWRKTHWSRSFMLNLGGV